MRKSLKFLKNRLIMKKKKRFLILKNRKRNTDLIEGIPRSMKEISLERSIECQITLDSKLYEKSPFKAMMICLICKKHQNPPFISKELLLKLLLRLLQRNKAFFINLNWNGWGQNSSWVQKSMILMDSFMFTIQTRTWKRQIMEKDLSLK